MTVNLRHNCTNMLVSKKSCRPNTNPNHPKANPNASQWNILYVGHFCVGFALGMSISCCLCTFSKRWATNANAVSGGIRA